MNDRPFRRGKQLSGAYTPSDWPRVDRSDEDLDFIPRALSDNRDRYIAQSAATKGGRVAPLPTGAPPIPSAA